LISKIFFAFSEPVFLLDYSSKPPSNQAIIKKSYPQPDDPGKERRDPGNFFRGDLKK
jgi:hypothetical protein